jgi:hypothetical protein
MHAYTSHVAPSLNGQYVAIIRDSGSRAPIAYTLPTSDRNEAARAGLSLRSLVTHS